MNDLKKSVIALKRAIFPKKCIICTDILTKPHEQYLCDACEHYILKNHICPRCGKPYYLGEKESCTFCEKISLPFSRLIGIFPYRGQCKESVLRWKYHGIRKYAKGFSHILLSHLKVLDDLDIEALIPVPIAPGRLKKRGFNQALDFAKNISLIKNIPVFDILIRDTDTIPQSKCSREKRRKNIRGIIKLKQIHSLKDINNIAIIDDIYTSGSTIEECIRVLCKEHAFKKIYVLVVCLGI